MSVLSELDPSRRRGWRARLRSLLTGGLLPSETREHLRNARRDQLLAVRSLLDALISRMERGKEGTP